MNRQFFDPSPLFSKVSRRKNCRKNGRARLSLWLGAALVLGSAGFRSAHANNLTFVVNTVADTSDPNVGDGICGVSGGPCSLRAAIQETNAQTGPDFINFNIPVTGVQSIVPLSPLPPITSPVTIDGYSQPGSSVNTLAVGSNAVLRIELNGQSAGNAADGLSVSVASCSIRGLAINRFLNGILLTGAGTSNNIVAGCFIGTNSNGTVARANRDVGISLEASGTGNLIGGTGVGARNLISGNAGTGILVTDGSNLIQGNLIGTDAAGDVNIGNGANGVFINSTGNLLGGTVAGARNIISGNGFTADGGEIPGLFINASNNTVQNNYVGTNAAGTFKVPNAAEGISIAGASGTLVEGNLVSGNTFTGIALFDGALRNIVRGNKIGLDAAGLPTLGNGRSGIGIGSVRDGQAESVGNLLTANSIAGNGALGIDLGANANADTFTGDGITPNDAGDIDRGPNNGQNFPVITGLSGQVVSGTLSSYPSEDFRIEVFASASADPSGSGEGQIFLGAVDDVATDAQGNATWSLTSPVAVAGKSLSATAIYVEKDGIGIGGGGLALDGDTSEFSVAFAAPVAPRNRQPAILGADDASNAAVVFPDAGELPNPTQKLVSGLPAGSRPHGISYFGQDNALISDRNASRIFVVQVSTFAVQATIDTASVGYTGTGTIAVAPNLNAALAMGATSTGANNRLYVIRAPFTPTSVITPITMPGGIPTFQTQAIVFDRAGRAFVFHSAGISVLDAPYDAVAFTIPIAFRNNGGAIAITPDGNTLLTTDNSGSNVSIFQAPFSATSLPTTLPIPNGVGLDGIVVTPDGTRALVVSGSAAQAAAISAPFSATSTVEQIPLPAGNGGFEDIGISPDGQIAIFTGNGGGSGTGFPAVFVRAPFGSASETFAVPIQSGTNNTRRGNGSVRFQPPGLAPGLTISKTAPATVLAGQTLTYTLSFQNTGSLAAAGVVIRDPLPAGTSFVSATDGGTLSGGSVVFNVGALQAGGAARNVSFTARATAAAGATLTNANYTVEATGVTPVAGPPVTTTVTAAPNIVSTISIADISVAEGNSGTSNAIFTVTLTQTQSQQQGRKKAAEGDITVQFATANGTATAPADYARTVGTLTFAPGQTTQTITVPVVGDTINEGSETFKVNLKNATGATISDGQAFGTILDNDPEPTVRISDVSVQEGQSGTRNATFTVRLSNLSTTPQSLDFSTANGTATAGSDYTATSGTLVIPAGKSGANIVVAISGDTLREANETFFVNLSQPNIGQDRTKSGVKTARALIGDGQGLGTILNDDLSSDLQITQSIAPDSIPVGGGATFTLQVKNNGPDASQGVSVTNALPVGSTFVSAAGATFTQSGQNVNFALGTLAVGEARTLTLIVQVPDAPGAFTNGASVSGTGAPDSNPANNSSSASALAVAGPQNVTALVQTSLGKLTRIGPYVPGLYRPGARFVQNVTIRNTSANALGGPVYLVLDGLPANVELVNRGGFTTLPSVDQAFASLNIGGDNLLSPGERATVRLEFRLGGNVKPNFTPRVIAGPGTP